MIHNQPCLKPMDKNSDAKGLTWITRRDLFRGRPEINMAALRFFQHSVET